MCPEKGDRSVSSGEKRRIQLYVKKDCHLCSVAKGVLLKVQKKIPFEFQEIDIESERDLYAQFKEKIPVVFINGKRAFVYRVDEGELIRILGRGSR